MVWALYAGILLFGPLDAWAAKFCAADYYVPEIPNMRADVAENFKMYAGHMPVDEQADRQLFFWLVRAKNTQPKDKLVIWLNGGPGCSSMDGMFLENGPFRVFSNQTVGVNEWSWWRNADMLYVDQPVGTGFSYVTNSTLARTQGEIAKDFVAFLNNLFIAFPDLRRNEIYFSGESFAGTYIPYIANEILDGNSGGSIQPAINLRGLIIGNGWIDPMRQYRAYLDFGRDHSLLSGKYMQQATELWEKCQTELLQGERIHGSLSCERILDQITAQSLEGGKYCLNVYDIRLRDTGPNQQCGMSWPPGLADVTNYLLNTSVIEAVHAGGRGKPWQECDGSVYTALSNDASPPAYTLFPKLLSQINITLFSGDQDLICNWYGTRDMIQNMNWGGQKGFQETTARNWYIDGKLAGTYQTSRNLSFVLVHQASHMVPIDQPMAALDVIHRAIGVKDPVLASELLDDQSEEPSERRQYYA
ncbi:Alpha/Beta hydrolase protein [Gaertneriomyces semiglobifer]|nr:Alpha/Beta hydrolase protein [Gaertneriomyces semiglobifer]